MVTGANGFMGQHLVLHLAIKGMPVIGTGRGICRIPNGTFIYEDVDLLDSSAVDALFKKYAPDVIIHTAAMTKPDECDLNRKLSRAVNVDATALLLRHSLSNFIYISTDFIFGEDGPHAENDSPEPLNFYGETKLLAEQLVKQSGKPHTIIRPVFMYGKVWEGLRPTFLHWVKNNLEQGKQIKVVSDQLRTPTYIGDICDGVESILLAKANGDFHFAGSNLLSPYQMALITAEVLHLDKSLIIEVDSGTFPEPVRRAKRSGLKIDKAIRELNYSPVSFEDGVRLTFGLR